MRRILFSITLSLIVFVGLILYFKITPVKATTAPADPEQVPVKVLVIAYDPILENQSNKRLHEYFEDYFQGAYDDLSPTSLTTKLIESLDEDSHGKVKYELTEAIHIVDEWPLHENGQRYTDTSYPPDFEDQDDEWDMGPVDYMEIINDFNIEARVNNGEVDEVWLLGGPGFGWFESAMAGNDAYEINGDVITGVNSKRFVVMGLNYERITAEALESYGHRAEHIMTHVYGSLHFPAGPAPTSVPSPMHVWDQFMVKDYDPLDWAGCSNVHGALNVEAWSEEDEYNTWSERDVQSNCEDWYNFPYLTGDTQTTDCNTWMINCGTQDRKDFIKWWFNHMPHVAGTMDGYLNNWWRYFTDVEQYKDNFRLLANNLLPTEDFAENNRDTWGTNWCSGDINCTDVDNTNKVVGDYSVKLLNTAGGSNTIWYNPEWAEQRVTGNWNVDPNGYVSFWVNLSNATGVNGPMVVTVGDDVYNQSAGDYNMYVYTSSSGLLANHIGSWHKFDIPLSGSSEWTRTTVGSPSFTNIDMISIQGGDITPVGYNLNIDGLGFSAIYGGVQDLTEDYEDTHWDCYVTGSGDCLDFVNTTNTHTAGTARSIEGDSADPVTLVYPAAKNSNWDLTNKTFVFWAKSFNENSGKFEGSSPKIKFVTNTSGSHYYTFQPIGTSLINSSIDRWQRYEIPLQGTSTYWTRTTTGSPSITDIDYLEITNDTTGTYFITYFDEMGFRANDITAPSSTITLPADGANVTGTQQINVDVSDDVAIKRVDLLVDGEYVETDALYPYVFFWDSTTVGNDEHTLEAKAYDMYGNSASDTITIDTNVVTDNIFSDDFESGNFSIWSAESDTENDFSVTTGAALHDTKGIAALIDNNTDMWVKDIVEGNEPRYRSRFYLDPNSITIGNGDLFTVLLGKDSAGYSFQVQLGYTTSGGYRVRTQIYNDTSSSSNGSWVNISDAPHAIEIDWKSSTASGANNGYISLWVDGTLQTTQSSIDNDTKRISEVRFGAPAGIDSGTSGTIYLDDFVSRRTTYIGTLSSPPSDLIFADGFESGTSSAWTSEVDPLGNLQITTGAALNGTRGLSALITDQTDMYVSDTTPANETRYRARFYLDPNSITMGAGETFTINLGRSSNGAAYHVQLNYSNTLGYRIRPTVFTDAGTYTAGSYYQISDAVHYIEIDWKASTAPGANNGYLQLWIDGTSQGTISSVDNDTKRVDEVRLGAVQNIDEGTSGTIYLDKYESHRTNYIGP